MNRRDFLKGAALAGTAILANKAAFAAEQAATPAAPAPSILPGNVPLVTLPNGRMIPQLGFGTLWLKEKSVASVRMAAERGYRLFDTAQGYGNEKEIWQGIREAGLVRSEVFITTKISTDNMRKPPQKACIERSIEALGGEYIDLMLIHWPVRDHIRETWETLEDFVRQGTIRSIGLSNFNPHHIDDLLAYAQVRPVLNQIEIHPYHSQEANIAAIRKYGLVVNSWSPLAQGKVLSEAALANIGKKHNKTPAQVTLRWAVQRGLVVIPRSQNPAHISENFGIFNFSLDDADMTAIAALNRNERGNPKNDPDNFPW